MFAVGGRHVLASLRKSLRTNDPLSPLPNTSVPPCPAVATRADTNYESLVLLFRFPTGSLVLWQDIICWLEKHGNRTVYRGCCHDSADHFESIMGIYTVVNSIKVTSHAFQRLFS